MSIEVVTPEDFAGAVMGDLGLRRGRIESVEPRVGSVVIRAVAPLAELLDFTVRLRAITHGRSSCSMHFGRYEPFPRNGESGPDTAGLTASKPNGPKPKSSFAAANKNEQSE